MTLLNSLLKKFLLLFIGLGIVSCNQEDDGELINEPAGIAEYFINNQTEKDLIVIFQKSESLRAETDTSNVISPNSSIEIFKDWGFGINPVPEYSFNELKFYEARDLTNPIHTISPVENEDWTITDQDLGESGYGLTIYELGFSE
ncbi:hypothetical protein [Christiangramia aquimixticola]|uniref:hypothetical protein n=1 Tax=Christiangramia aquimixticola TaxID=1697558 RepID=UPI003AA8BDCA